MLSTAYLNLQMCEPELALAAVTKIDQVFEFAKLYTILVKM